ncbi:MAG: hypothetical protein IPK26_17390 [Planctomycetes bacterium]|nr:hypothetical protein [Planctomycetota bacterium]
MRIFPTDVGEGEPWQPLLTVREARATVGWMSVARDGTALLALPDDRQFLPWQVPATVQRH